MPFDVIDGIRSIAVPQQPFDPLQRGCLGLGCGGFSPRTLDHLPQHGQPHGDMEPIQHMLGFRRDVLLQAPKRISAVR